MPLNKPRYTLFKNTTYALNGLLEVAKHENSFKLQLVLFAVMSVVAWYLPIDFAYAAILWISLFIPIMAEIANSAVERVVDLVTMEHHELAKRAKDAGAALVFVSLLFTAAIWLCVLIVAFGFL